jgi:hypothetical protein
MSTKIYYGYKYHNTSVLDVHRLLLSLRNQCVKDVQPAYDHDEFSACVYFFKDYTLLTFHGPYFMCDKYPKLIPDFKFWGYWNNTDQDEDCDDDEWAQRELEWSFLDIPVYDGFCFVLANHFLVELNKFE